MVCIYCGQKTQVTNTRQQRRTNRTWRRRSCEGCGAVFTSSESPDLSKSVVVVLPTGAFSAFQRDKLMISVYDAVRHRKTAQADATALTDTIIAKILAVADAGGITRNNLTQITLGVLAAFDTAAASHYAAFHTAHITQP